jgi:hypothetical protein
MEHVVVVALTPRVHWARESLPRGPPSPQCPALMVRTVGCPAEILEQEWQVAVDPGRPSGGHVRARWYYLGHVATIISNRGGKGGGKGNHLPSGGNRRAHDRRDRRDGVRSNLLT